DATGTSIKKIVRTLRTVRSATIEITGQHLTLDPEIPNAAQKLLHDLDRDGHQVVARDRSRPAPRTRTRPPPRPRPTAHLRPAPRPRPTARSPARPVRNPFPAPRTSTSRTRSR